MEISQKRLEAIRELVLQITDELRLPLDEMGTLITDLHKKHEEDNLKTYLTIIRTTCSVSKRKLKTETFETDKTIPYIKDIRMFDLSDG
ncbi:MAG: hypothetical protein KF749_13760 [Bacteroidetes bacterium]|nr:hypothetical protein [Bacteroidota bacterium]